MINQIRWEHERLATVEEWLDEVEAAEVMSEAPGETGELEGMFSLVATMVDRDIVESPRLSGPRLTALTSSFEGPFI
jgi:hypothetical protein